MLKYLQIHSLRCAEFAVSPVVPDLVNNVWSFAEKRWQPHEFSDKELLRQIKLHQEAPQQPEEAAISVATASNNCQPYKGDPFPACSIYIGSLGPA